jgi:hypothetical protein
LRDTKTGWGNPHPDQNRGLSKAEPQFHYFGPNGLSLCEKHGVGDVRELEEGRDNHPHNCPDCLKKKREQDAKVQVE